MESGGGDVTAPDKGYVTSKEFSSSGCPFRELILVLLARCYQLQLPFYTRIVINLDKELTSIKILKRPYFLVLLCSWSNALLFQSGIDPSLAEKLLEEASSRAEVLRGENIRLRDLLISHLQQTMQILGDNDHVEQQMCDTE